MKTTRGRVVLGLVAVVVAAALIPHPVWAEGNAGAAPMIAISLSIMLANVYVLIQPMPARHRH